MNYHLYCQVFFTWYVGRTHVGVTVHVTGHKTKKTRLLAA